MFSTNDTVWQCNKADLDSFYQIKYVAVTTSGTSSKLKDQQISPYPQAFYNGNICPDQSSSDQVSYIFLLSYKTSINFDWCALIHKCSHMSMIVFYPIGSAVELSDCLGPVLWL